MTVSDDSTAVVRDRGYLPHWEQYGAIYFVTFRLADSLPQRVIEKLQADQQLLAARVAGPSAQLTPAQQVRMNHAMGDRVQAALDAGHGSCMLARPDVADLVAQALKHFDGIRYRLLCWCVMPNHVHVVFQPLDGHQLAKVIHSWKSFTASQANRFLGRHGDFWQREYYDHIVRDEADLVRIVDYVVQNPAKATLADWNWVYVRAPDEWATQAGATGRRQSRQDAGATQAGATGRRQSRQDAGATQAGATLRVPDGA